MLKPKLVAETPITMAEMKDELKRVQKRDGELNFRATRTEEYLNNFLILKRKDAEELTKKIEELNIPRLRIEHIAKLIDLLPSTADEVKSVLQGYTITISKENIKRISDVIAEYSK